MKFISGKYLKNLFRKLMPNPLDRKLKKAAAKGAKKILIPWNRGLGDIPLGLYAIITRIYKFIPDAQITFITRKDLADGFSLLPNVHTIINPEWKRKTPYTLPQDLSSYDLVLENPDPTYWVSWQLGTLTPKLTWNATWDTLYKKFNLPEKCLGVHVNSETSYGYEKNWPVQKFEELFSKLSCPILLFGLHKTHTFAHPNVIDLRGDLTLPEMLSIIKNRCATLITPDSGILSLVYYITAPFPIRIISLWADPNQGILKQNVASPNPLLQHTPILSSNPKTAAVIPLQDVINALKILKPLSSYAKSGNKDAYIHGKKLLSQGKVGCLILSGGQGTRLSSSKPKALTPITLIKHKTLLQLLCEKTLAASHQSNQKLPLAIMTSPLNHQEIASFLQEHQFFGLNPSQVSLFEQEMLPLLDDTGAQVALGPDGNGHSLKLFVQSGVYKKWNEQGIEYLSMIPIDNPLADPFDAELLGVQNLSQSEIGIKAIIRDPPQESVGILGTCNGKTLIQEYSEMPQDSSPFTLGNTGLFSFSLSFIEKTAHLTLPLHGARKQYSGTPVWKCERFIFDLFPHSKKTCTLVYPREEIYSPIKNASGDKSIETAQRDLLNFDRRTYESISGLTAAEKEFELSPSFYYPTPELLKKWERKEIPFQNYID